VETRCGRLLQRLVGQPWDYASSGQVEELSQLAVDVGKDEDHKSPWSLSWDAMNARSREPCNVLLPTRFTVPFVAKNDWTTGEVVAFRLSSGLWTLFRVIGHHVDKGGRQAVCEPLDWLGPNPPNSPTIGNLLVGSNDLVGLRRLFQLVLLSCRR
jgi:hypothetical protein